MIETCDCFVKKCEECEETFPIHIGDSVVSRGEVRVFCEYHLPYGRKNLIKFLTCEQINDVNSKMTIFGNPKIVGLEYVSKKAFENSVVIHPNTTEYFILQENLKAGRYGGRT